MTHIMGSPIVDEMEITLVEIAGRTAAHQRQEKERSRLSRSDSRDARACSH